MIKLPPLPHDEFTKQKLGEYWLLSARMEHASIGAFARLTLELLSLGAPPKIIQDSLRAASDEVRHAELCFSLASHYLGQSVSPGEYPGIISGGIRSIDKNFLARESFIDGAIGEGISCAIALKQSEISTDKDLAKIYMIISQDEGRHAKLAWDIIAWILATTSGNENEKIQKMLQNQISKITFSDNIDKDWEYFFDGQLSAQGFFDMKLYREISDSIKLDAINYLKSIPGYNTTDTKTKKGTFLTNLSQFTIFKKI